MVNVAGFGQDVRELIIVLDAFFILAVVLLAMSTHNLNVFEHSYNILNTVFFKNAQITNMGMCSQIFNNFNAIGNGGVDANFGTITIAGVTVSLFGDVVRGIVTLLNLIVGLLLFFVTFILGCGIGAVLLIIGWAIPLTIIYNFMKLVSTFNRGGAKQ